MSPVVLRTRPHLNDLFWKLRGEVLRNSLAMLVESALQGIGFAGLPAFAVEKHIERGALNRLLCEYECLPERAIYAIYPDKRFLPSKVRKFIDLLYYRLN